MRASNIAKQNDESAYNEFLAHYPYDDDRKNQVQGIMQRQERLLTRYYDEMVKQAILKNPSNNQIIFYRIWAFSICDMAYDELIGAKHTEIDEQKTIEDIINKIKRG